MLEQIVGSWICWLILALALFTYYQLWVEYFTRDECLDFETRQTDAGIKREFSSILISTLPLLGLLGTIVGLLECFAGIASEGSSLEVMAGGIGDALITTQLGLVCAIPGWLLQSYTRSKTSVVHSVAADSVPH